MDPARIEPGSDLELRRLGGHLSVSKDAREKDAILAMLSEAALRKQVQSYSAICPTYVFGTKIGSLPRECGDCNGVKKTCFFYRSHIDQVSKKS